MEKSGALERAALLVVIVSATLSAIITFVIPIWPASSNDDKDFDQRIVTTGNAKYISSQRTFSVFGCSTTLRITVTSLAVWYLNEPADVQFLTQAVNGGQSGDLGCLIKVAVEATPSGIISASRSERLVRPIGGANDATWTLLAKKAGPVRIQFFITAGGSGETVGSIALEPEVSSADVDRAAARADRYVNDVHLAVAPSQDFDTGHKRVLSVRVSKEAEAPGSETGQSNSDIARGIVKICLHAAGAAKSTEQCLEKDVALVDGFNQEIPIEVEVNDDGAVEVLADTSLTYSKGGRDYHVTGPSSAFAGSASMNWVDRAKAFGKWTTIAAGSGVLAAIGGGIAFYLARKDARQPKKKRTKAPK